MEIYTLTYKLKYALFLSKKLGKNNAIFCLEQIIYFISEGSKKNDINYILKIINGNYENYSERILEENKELIKELENSS